MAYISFRPHKKNSLLIIILDPSEPMSEGSFFFLFCVLTLPVSILFATYFSVCAFRNGIFIQVVHPSVCMFSAAVKENIEKNRSNCDKSTKFATDIV